MSKRNLLLMLCLVFFMGSTVIAQNKYVGANACKMCHNSATKGDQFKKWQASKHSQAMASLSSPKSVEWGKANGGVDASKEAKCLKCHSTLGSVDQTLKGALTSEEGVSCESCHGAGSAYKGMAIMKVQADAVKAGLVIPDEKTCLVCHAKGAGNPFEKDFNFADYSAKIAHKKP